MKSGVIPFYQDNKGMIHMYFMIPSDPKYGGPNPQVAKGNIENGETPRIAALREGNEELGLIESNILSVIDCGLCKNPLMHVFAAEIMSAVTFDKPQFETGSTRWLTWDKFKMGGRKTQQMLVTQTYRKIQNYYKGKL